MMSPLLKMVIPGAALALASAAAQGVLIRNATTDVTLFNSFGFEYDAPGGPAANATGYWSNGDVSRDFVVTGGTPGAFEGAHYLNTTRNASGAGNPRAFLATPQSTAGHLIHAEWMMYVTNPPLSDIGFAWHDAAGTNKGQVRIGGNGLGTLADSWGGTIRSNAYQTNTWQKWELDYAIGSPSYSVNVNGGASFNATVPGGANSFGYLSFFHNGSQTYYIDAVSPPALGDYDPQPQQSLQRMIDIDWELGPRTPKGLQDGGAGVIHNTLISVGGFNGGSGPGERGFHHETWGLNLANPAAGWQNLPAYPGSNNPANVDGAGRQGFLFTTVGERLYAWGGFNYTSPATYADGYKLSRTAGVWAWSPLPDLPTRRSGGGMVTVGTKIYAVGGADYDLTKSYTRTDRTGTIGDYGARIYAMDTASPVPTWQELPTMPGTPRYVHATAAVGDKIYVIGGATGAHPQTHTVVDNWVFDTTTQAWSRIRDLPVASANFPSGRIVVDDRYILLAGGYQYGAIENPDGSTRPVYGTPGKADPSNPFYNDIWVYDTETNLFGTATSMPLDNNLPTTVYFDGKLHMIGGETDGATIFGQEFAHHPDLYLIGTPRLATPGSQWNSSASGNWHAAANWAGGVPNAPGAVARFLGAIGVPRTVFADSPVNVGSIVFDNNNSYLLTGQGSITIQTAAGPALIDVQRGAHRINLPLTIATDTTLQVAPGAALTISDPVTINPDRMLTHSGGGTVVYESTVKLLPGGGIVFGGSAALATLDVGAAAVAVIVSGGDKVLSVSRLNIAPGGALDLKDNDLMVDYDAGHSPIGKIRQHVIDGIHHRAGGILADEGGKVLAIVENTWLARSEWNGVPVDNSTVLGVHTWFGDANLDGEVTTDDYAAIDAALGTAGTARWIDGDFTFEGDVTGIDYAAIDANLGMGTADPLAYVELRTRMIAQHGERFGEGYRTALAAAEAGNFVVVPEPGGFAAVAGAALALLRRRRPAQGLNLIE